MARTFEAKDMQDALAQIRAAMGVDAVILSSEKTSKGITLSAAPIAEAVPHPTSGGIASFEARYRDKLLARLREKHDGKAVHIASFSRPELLAQLRAHRVPDALSHALAESAEQSGYADAQLALASALDKRMEIASIAMEKENVLLIVGPNGAGKTAIAAKLAAEAKLAGREVRLAAADTKSAGQRERLETFAVHLSIPVIDTSAVTLFLDAVKQARDDGALLIADTAGIDPRDPPRELLDYTQTTATGIVGVVSASMDAEEASETAIALAKLGAERIIVTGLDLSRRKGAVAALATSTLALAHATSSPYLVDGLDSLTPPALARALLTPL